MLLISPVQTNNKKVGKQASKEMINGNINRNPHTFSHFLSYAMSLLCVLLNVDHRIWVQRTHFVYWKSVKFYNVFFFFFSELKKKRPGLNDKLKKDLSLCKG